MKRRKSEKEQKLADNSYLLRAWRKWHREQLEEARAGRHAVIVTHVMEFLKTMTPASANALLELMRGHTWADVDANTKFIVLHEINDAITRMREKHGMAPIDDPIAPKVNAFIAMCQILHMR
jgi:hypothetical protein